LAAPAANLAGMSDLNSASDWDAIKAAYANNASYDEDGSAAKARAFVTACRLLLLNLPKRVSKGGRLQGEEIEFDPRLLAEQIAEAQRWLSAYDVANSPARGFSIRNFRF
jgi:hypothetical protein